MHHKMHHKDLEVGQVGAIEVSLPLLEFGGGDPTVLILVGLHGDETTGYFVVTRLIDRLVLKKGTLHIIMAANPLAQALQQRWEPISNKDVNRAFPGDLEGEFTDRLAARLLEQARGCACVIDFHTFGLERTRLTAIFMNHGPRQVRERSLELIHTFAPERIWQLDTRTEEQQQWAGSMGPEMAAQGIVNFAVELPESFWADDAIIDLATDGTLRVLAELDMVEGMPQALAEQPLMYSRREVYADRAGIWLPRQDLIEELVRGNVPSIAEGDMLGTLVDLRTLDEMQTTSPQEGLLPSMLDRTVVRTGDTLYVIGMQKPWTMLADDTVEKIAMFAKHMDWQVAFGGKSKGNRHLERVARLASYMTAREPGADRSICQAGAWLHDIGLTVDVMGPASVGNPIAESFLTALGEKDVDEETRERILRCIEAHEYHPDVEGGMEPQTVEARIVHDADMLDKLGPLAVIRHTWKLANSGRRCSPEDILDLLQEHFDQQRRPSLLTEAGQQLAEKLDSVYSSVLQDFLAHRARAVPLIADVMHWAREGVNTETIIERLSEQYEDDFVQALEQQIEQAYLEEGP